MRVHFKDQQIDNKKNKNVANNQNVSFSGYNLVKDDKGAPTLRFFLPADNKYNISVEIVPLDKTPQGDFSPKENVKTKELKFEQNKNFIDVDPKQLDYKNEKYIGYKFYLIGQDGSKTPYTDPGLRTGEFIKNYTGSDGTGNKDGDYTVIDLTRPASEAPRQMLHIIPDNFAPEYTIKDGKPSYDIGKFLKASKMQRSFVNKYDGNIKGIIAKLDDAKELGAKRIISTPIFGQDNASAFGYWTSNPYQVTSALGDINDFKNLQTEVFKRGMGWIADGAFVNEGLEGVHVRDVLKKGEKSPYFDWFKSYLSPMNTFELGVLPNNTKKLKDVGINFVNAPYIYSTDDKGNASKEKNKDYDSSKPTYIQIFPKNKVSKSLLNKSEPIKSADIKKTESFESQTYKDSVNLYSFEVTPSELEKNYKRLKDNNSDKTGADAQSAFVTAFSTYNNFSLVPKSASKGLETWGGNDDILKLKFMMSDKEKSLILEGNDANKQNKLDAVNQVQDYILQVGGFWTKETANTITEYTAKTISKNLENKTPQGYKNAIDAISNKDLDSSIKDKINKNVITNVLNGTYKLPQDLETGKDVKKNVIKNSMSYPLDAIEFGTDLTAVLGSPYIKKLGNNPKDVMKSRYELSKDKSYGFVGETYRETYKEMDSFYQNELSDFAADILKMVDAKKANGEEKLLKDPNQLSELGKELYPLISNDIVKFAVVKSLKNDASVKDENGQLKYNPSELNNISAKSLGLSDSDSERAARETVKLLKSGVKNISQKDKELLAQNIAKRFKDVDANTLKVSKAIVDKTESGLEWRIDAAKDIGNLSDLSVNEDTFDNVFKNVTDFWGKFATKVRENNPNAYIIGELTDIDSLAGKDPTNKYRNAGDAEGAFVLDSGFTTVSNYNYHFDPLQNMYGRKLEPSAFAAKDTAPKLKQNLVSAWGGVPGFLFNNPIDSVLYSHTFMDNHDKPRILHGFALDMDLFYSDMNNDHHMNIARQFWGNDIDPKKINPKSTAVGHAISDAIYKTDNIDSDTKKLLENSLKDLVTGSYKGKSFDATWFAVKPFDQSIDDVFAQAGHNSTAFKSFAEDPMNEQRIKEMKDGIHENLMKPAFQKYLASLSMLVALPGNPAIFSGTELGETGYETPDHNVYLQCRNRNHWEWISQDNKDYQKYNKQYVIDFNKQVKELFTLRNKKELSPLVDGYTTVLQDPTVTSGDAEAIALFRYNKDTDLIEVISKNGFGRNTEGSKTKPYQVDHIGLNPTESNGIQGLGLPKGLNVGTTYVLEKIGSGSNDSGIYKVIKNKGSYMLKKFANESEYQKYSDFNKVKEMISKSEDKAQKRDVLIDKLNRKYGINLEKDEASIDNAIDEMFNKNQMNINSAVAIFRRKDDYSGNSFNADQENVAFCGKSYIQMFNKKYPFISSYNTESAVK